MADAFADEAEQTVTINEYIEGIEAEELEADLVLGGDEGKECTYPNGYMKRQAIFSCLTCVPGGSAGICTACSLSCHDSHEVVELWTKRNFRCDCGNSKFGAFTCKLFSNKDPENIENSYNHNFKGSYCICGRPYPDPEAEEQVGMIQCGICEDWFHENHLGLQASEGVPRDEEGVLLFDELICQHCAVLCSFLKLYPASIWAPSRQHSPVGSKDVISENVPASGSCESDSVPSVNDPLHSGNSAKEIGIDKNNTCPNNNDVCSECILGVDLRKMSLVMEQKPMFLSKKWRDVLCRCGACGEFYAKNGISYLIDKEDFLEEYESMAKMKREEKLQQQEGAELNFLNTLNHVQNEILNGIADMKNELQSFMMSQKGSSSVERLSWDQTRLAFFTHLLLDQQRQGKKGDNGWKLESWTYMLDAFQVRFNQVTSIDQLKALVQVMRKEYGVIEDMLKQSGFGWNPVTRMVETTDDIWDVYLKQNKEAKKWRNTTITLYDQWFELFDGSSVDGRRQQSTLYRVESSYKEREPHGSPLHSVHLDLDNEDSAASSPPSLKRSTRKEKSKSKSKRSKIDDEISIVEAIHAAREEYRKSFVPVSITMIQEAMKIVMTMSELSAAEKAKVSNIIRTGAAYATFLEMDHETRLEWIKLELGR